MSSEEVSSGIVDYDGDLSDQLPDGCVAIVFAPSGNRTLFVPHMRGSDVVPTHVLAATELFLQLADRDDASLAEEFEVRRAEGS